MKDIKENFASLIIDNSNLINKICNVYANKKEDFDDLRQEIIYQLWKSYPTFKNDSKFQTWMYKVALNTALHHKRSNSRLFAPLTSKIETVDDDTSHQHQKEELIEKMYSAIWELNNLDRAIIFLYLEKCSYEKISEIVGLSEKNVSVKLTRIKEILKKKLNK